MFDEFLNQLLYCLNVALPEENIEIKSKKSKLKSTDKLYKRREFLITLYTIIQ